MTIYRTSQCLLLFLRMISAKFHLHQRIYLFGIFLSEYLKAQVATLRMQRVTEVDQKSGYIHIGSFLS